MCRWSQAKARVQHQIYVRVLHNDDNEELVNYPAEYEEELFALSGGTGNSIDPLVVTMELDGKMMDMKVDTRACKSKLASNSINQGTYGSLEHSLD